MLYITPDYYDEFSCTADKCEDTCCAGWQIVIDKESLKKFRNLGGEFGKRMRRSVNWFGKTFKQDKEKRCAFLNDRNLCDLYLSQGEDGFCHTCRNYPRHTEEFEGVREITLSVSCPEVAKILMNRMEPVEFNTKEDDIEEEFEDFDPFLFSVIEDGRKVMIKILQNRELPVSVRVSVVIEMAKKMQEMIDDGRMFFCSELIEEFENNDFSEFKCESYVSVDTVSNMFSQLYKLELLKPEWDICLKKTDLLLYGNGKDEYSAIRSEFEDWKKSYSEFDIHLEQLLVYFLFTYLPGSVYDGELASKVYMAVYCVRMISELWMAKWLENGRELERIEMTELVYRFSREVEHSDKNLKRIEELVSKLF